MNSTSENKTPQKIHDLEIQLAEARQQAADANAAKDIFLTNMSHEIRSPLNGIMGMAYLALNTELTPTQRNYLEKIHGTCLSLLSIINDLLDFSKIESNRLELENQPLLIADEMDAVLKLISSQALAKRLNVTSRIAPDVPDSVMGDALRLRQILLNLGSNAVKFSKQGNITFEAQLLESCDQTVRLRFSVSDQGIGMTPEQIEHIFSPFTQADGSLLRNFGGTGLGLALCHRLASLMGGDIGVTSEMDKGSTFTVDLPFGKCATPVAAEDIADDAFDSEPQDTLAGLRVLLVEDNDINREIMEVLLTDMGVEVISAVNGKEAVDIWTNRHADIALILSDIQMPVMDGYTASRKIRASGLPRAQEIPIIALTAHALRGDAERSFEAGMNKHLTKPIDVEQITQTLREYAHP